MIACFINDVISLHTIKVELESRISLMLVVSGNRCKHTKRPNGIIILKAYTRMCFGRHFIEVNFRVV